MKNKNLTHRPLACEPLEDRRMMDTSPLVTEGIAAVSVGVADLLAADAREAAEAETLAPRAFVEWTRNPTYTQFNVRFRNPADASRVRVTLTLGTGRREVLEDSFAHRGGTAEGTYGFCLAPNAGPGVAKALVELASPAGTVLDRVEVLYDSATQTTTTAAPQKPWSSASSVPENPDLRSFAPSLDGNTAEERAAIDALLESSLSASLGKPVRLDLAPPSGTPRTRETETGIDLAFGDEEFSAICAILARTTAASGTSRSALQPALTEALLASPVEDALTGIATGRALAAEEAARAQAEEQGTVAEPVMLQEAAERQAAAEGLAAAVLEEVQEEANRIPHARMNVELSGGAQFTNVTVRFRNPGPRTIVEIINPNKAGMERWLIRETVDHPEGTRDGTWGLRLDRVTNGPSGTVMVRLFADAKRKVLLDEATLFYDAAWNDAVLLTENLPMDDVDAGMMEKEPIVPKLEIARVEGTQVLVAFQAPTDKTVLSFDQGGTFATAESSHEGGTLFSMASVTFPHNRASGDYALTLRDRAYGKIFGSVTFHWDQATRMLTPTDAPIGLTMAPMDGSDPGAAAAAEAFERIRSISAINIADNQIQRIYQTQLYEKTATLSGAQKLFVSLDEGYARALERRPEFKGENWDAEIDRRWNTQFAGFQRGDVARWFHEERTQYLENARVQLGAYADACGLLLQDAVNVLLQMKQGGDEGVLRARFAERVAAAERRAGVDLPDSGAILGAAKTLFDYAFNEGARAIDAVAEFERYMDGQRKKIELEAAQQEWKNSGGSVGTLPKGMSRREIRLAAKIRNVLATSQDPRILAMTGRQKSVVAVKYEKSLTSAPDRIVNIDALIDEAKEEEHMQFFSTSGAEENLLSGIAYLTAEQIPPDLLEVYLRQSSDAWDVFQADPMISNSTVVAAAGNLELGSGPTGQGSIVLRETQRIEHSDYLKRSLKQIVLGNYTDEVTGLGIAGQIALGFTGLDFIMDGRDITFDFTHWEWTWGHAGKTTLDGIGFLPVIGVVKNVAKNADEIYLIVKTGEKEVGIIRGFTKTLTKLNLTEGDIIRIRHIIRGEVRNGFATGGHSFSAIRSGMIQVVEGTQSIDGSGVMKANIKIWDSTKNAYVTKGPHSTFFPETWTDDEIIEATKEAWNTKVVDNNGKWTGMGKGIRIRLIVGNDMILSAHPLFEP